MPDITYVTVDNDTVRDAIHIADAEAKTKAEAAHAKKIFQFSLGGLAVTAVGGLLLYRFVLGHLGTLLAVVTAVVCLLMAIATAGAEMERPKPKALTPEWSRAAMRKVRTGEAAYEAISGDTGHLTAEGARKKATDTANGFAKKEEAVTRAAVLMHASWILVTVGVASVAFTKTIGAAAIIIIVLVAAKFVQRTA